VTGEPQTRDGPRILVVDDNEDNRYTLKLYLDLEGYRNIVAAQDGEEALAHLETGQFDLVLLDVVMPKVDGYEVLKRLKAQGNLHNIPVIMISALGEMASVVRCIEVGAVDYLIKPFDAVLLRARISASLEKKRLSDELHTHLARLRTELDAARQLQMSMVPSVFPRPTPQNPAEIFASMEPAREVGGDLYDFFYSDDGKLYFLVGDVSGKGMPAALFMARAKSLVRLAAELLRASDGRPASPADIVARVNRELCQDNTNLMFITLFFATLAPDSGEVEYCNAGHNPPYHVSSEKLEAIEGGKGIILGVRPDAAYVSGRLTLAPGDSIYVFTDGVTEAANPQDEMFSEERLKAVLRGAAGCSSAEMVKSVTAALRDFVGNALPSDDITMLAIRHLDPSTMQGGM
jgi:sigma-B regulation protein RsbU (phosphoserine phosphatase)